MKRTMRRTLRKMRTAVSCTPAIYLPIARMIRGDWVVSPSTDIIIEGYPRSGNSFAEAAFRLANGERNLVIAHHSHAAAQVIGAARWGIPSLVILREPIESCRSLLMMSPDVFDAQDVLHEYIVFHRGIEKVRDRFVLASFEAVTADFGKVIDLVNDKFGKDFERFEHTPENSRLAFEHLDQLSRERGTAGESGEPYSVGQSDEFRALRELQKERVREELERPALASLREKATAVYEQLKNDCDI